MHTRFCLLFFLIQLISSLNLHFPNQLQRFVYNQPTDTIVLASINHIYSLNASDLTILSHIDLSLSKTNDQFCLKTNRTSLPKNLYYFSTISYLNSTNDKVFNQLLLPTSNNFRLQSMFMQMMNVRLLNRKKIRKMFVFKCV